MEIFRLLGLDDAVTLAGAHLKAVGGLPSARSLAEWASKQNAAAALPRRRFTAALRISLGGLLFYAIWLGLSFAATTLVLCASLFGFAVSWWIAFCCMLAVLGWVMARFVVRPILQRVAMGGRFTFCTQDLLEPVLLRALSERGVQPHFDTRFVRLQQDEKEGNTGVAVQLRPTSAEVEHTVHARFVLACDGARSCIRSEVGTAWEGTRVPTQQLNLLFRADLSPLLGSHLEATTRGGRFFSLLNIVNPGDSRLPLGRALLAMIDLRERWVLHVSVPSEVDVQKEYSEEQCKDMVRAMIGLHPPSDRTSSGARTPNNQRKQSSQLRGTDQPFPIEILGRQAWRSHRRVASHYRVGRVFFAGDACHV